MRAGCARRARRPVGNKDLSRRHGLQRESMHAPDRLEAEAELTNPRARKTGHLQVEEMLGVLKACGLTIVGPTEWLVPADRTLYFLRDRTGTVESPFLIRASIMSKKLAGGLDALVLDVKTGSGAFLKLVAEAIHLAELMAATGNPRGHQNRRPHHQQHRRPRG
jgi:hypothetical protein